MERWLLLAVLSLGWGSAYLFQDESVAEIGPLTLTAIRLVAAALLLFIVLRLRGLHLPTGRREWLFFLAIGGIGNLLPFALTTWAQQDVKSSMAGILTAVVPLVTLVLAHFLGDERLTLRRTIGFLVGFAGVVVLLGLDVAGRPGELLGAAAILLSAFCYAVGPMILKRKLADLDPRASMGAALAIAAIVLTPAAVLAPPSGPPSAEAVVSLVVLGILCTAAAFAFYGALVAEAGAGRALVITYVAPVVAVALGVAVLGERPGAGAGAGLLLILAGSWLATGGRMPPGRRRRAQPPLPPAPG